MKANGDRVGAHMRTSRVRQVPRFSSLESSEPRGLARALDGALDLIYHNIAGTQTVGVRGIKISRYYATHVDIYRLAPWTRVGRIG